MMKKYIGMFFAAILFLFLGAVPAFGQHGKGGHGGGGGRSAGHAGGVRGGARGGASGGEVGRGGEARGGERGGEARGGERGGFREGFARDNFGRGHSFRFGGGERFGNGWRFNYGGYVWGYDAWPIGWGIDDPVYIDADGDVEYLYDPLFPDTRLQLNVVF